MCSTVTWCKRQIQTLNLGRPHFCTPGPVDILIGAGVFAQTLLGPSLSLGNNMPYNINTIVRYLCLEVHLFDIQHFSGLSTLLLVYAQKLNLCATLQSPWSLEKSQQGTKLSQLKEQWENHFSLICLPLTAGISVVCHWLEVQLKWAILQISQDTYSVQFSANSILGLKRLMCW